MRLHHLYPTMLGASCGTWMWQVGNKTESIPSAPCHRTSVLEETSAHSLVPNACSVALVGQPVKSQQGPPPAHSTNVLPGKKDKF